VRFLVDAQLPPIVVRYLISTGHEAMHVGELGLSKASDRDIWRQAVDMGAALITKDEDFVTMRAFDSSGPAIVWVRVGNSTNRQLLARFIEKFSAVVSALNRGETVIEISAS
jgi:predicted nuclease of predicted toxin-antitoxin system